MELSHKKEDNNEIVRAEAMTLLLTSEENIGNGVGKQLPIAL